MFPLFHDRTRRLLCRSMFLLLGLLPTGAVLAWSIAINGEAHRTAISEQLSQQFGCEVRIRDLTYLRQNIKVLEGFDLVDPETSAVLLSAPQVEVRENEQSTSATAVEAELTIAGRDWWRPALDRRLRLSRQQQRPLSIRAEKITLVWPKGEQELHDCKLEFGSYDLGNIAEATFGFGDQAANKHVQLQFQRMSDAGQPISSVVLNTGAASLPCALLAAALAESNPFGAASTFRGTLRANDGPDGWHMQVDEGVVEQVDLAVLASQHFPGRCTGTAELQLRNALFRRGHIEQMECDIKAGSGTISLEALTALADFLRLPPPQDTPAEQPFDELAAKLKLSSQGTIVAGQCEGTNGALIRSGSKAVLTQPLWQLPRWGRW